MFGTFGILIPVAQALVLWLFSTLAHNADDARIRAGGKAAEGEVLRVEEDAFGPTLNNVRPKKVIFRYKADGVEHEKSVTVNAPGSVRVESGRPVAIVDLNGEAILADIHPAEFPIPPGLIIASIVCWSLAVKVVLAYGLAGARRKYPSCGTACSARGKLLSFETWNMFPVISERLVPRLNVWADGFNLSWEIDFWGQYRRSVEAAEADLNASNESYGDTLVMLLSEVATSYVQLRTYEQRLKFARENVEIQKRSLSLAEARWRTGRSTELDVRQAHRASPRPRR